MKIYILITRRDIIIKLKLILLFRPRFRSDNGHLYIESSTNHNITLNTKGQGYINVNNENLLQIIGLVFKFISDSFYVPIIIVKEICLQLLLG